MTTNDRPQVTLDLLIRANYPVIVVNSPEEARVTKLTKAAVKEQTFEDETGAVRNKALYQWTGSAGLVRLLGSTATQAPAGEDTEDPIAALKALEQWATIAPKEPTVFLFKDLHGYLSDPRVVRHLRDIVALFQTQPNTLILVSPVFPVPDDLQKDIVVLDWPLPDDAELAAIVDRAVKALRQNKSSKIAVDLEGKAREQVISALKGLSAFEASSVLSMAAVTNLALDVRALPLILKEKKAIIKSVTGLEFIEASVSLADIGGLYGLKAYAAEVELAFDPAAAEFGLDKPSGVLLVGVPGGGKSMVAKVLAGGKRATVRVDLSALKGGIVGATESNTLQALKVIDALGDVNVWFDEIEKALGGVGGGASLDGGTSVGQFGILLTWMQERRERNSGAYIVATSNGVEGIPPEFLRRFDDIFFVNTPNDIERAEIVSIHLRHYGRQPADFDLAAVVKATQDYTGDEIRKVVRAAINRAFKEGARDLTTADLIGATKRVIPIAKTDPASLAKLRKWAATRARSAHVIDEDPAEIVSQDVPDLAGSDDDE